MAELSNGNIYLLFERGKKKLYESIAVARFNLEWITKGQDWRKLLKDLIGSVTPPTLWLWDWGPGFGIDS